MRFMQLVTQELQSRDCPESPQQAGGCNLRSVSPKWQVAHLATEGMYSTYTTSTSPVCRLHELALDAKSFTTHNITTCILIGNPVLFEGCLLRAAAKRQRFSHPFRMRKRSIEVICTPTHRTEGLHCTPINPLSPPAFLLHYKVPKDQYSSQ